MAMVIRRIPVKLGFRCFHKVQHRKKSVLSIHLMPLWIQHIQKRLSHTVTCGKSSPTSMQIPDFVENGMTSSGHKMQRSVPEKIDRI